EAGDIHPKNKIPVGERLAQSALALTYGRDLVPTGPIASAFTTTGNAIRIDFSNADTGLSTTDGTAPSHIFLAGEDRVFHPATAPIASACTPTGNAIRIGFSIADTGLGPSDGTAPSHIVLADEDRVFHPATARIEGAALVVTSPAVPSPVAVRYAWADNPEG